MSDEQLDEICGWFLETPTDGSGLAPELLELGKVFTKRYEKPAIFCSSEFALPHFHSGHDGGPWGSMREPPTVRLLMMNLGQEDAKGVTARLRSPGDEGEVWASGQADIPARSVAVALLDILPGKQYNGWTGTEILEVEAPGSAVFIFTDSRFHGR